MYLDTGSSLAGAVIALEAAEQRFASGERPAALRQAALRAYHSAATNTNSAQAVWRREVMERAQHIIDACG